MSLNVPLLQQSFTLVAELEPELALRFYGELFHRYPQLEPLFSRHSRGRQAQMLTEMLAAVISHLEDEAWLVSNLRGLGVRHIGYGVTPEMYPMVGESLLATLAAVAGPQWSPALQQAWAEAFTAISTLMLSAYPIPHHTPKNQQPNMGMSMIGEAG